MKSKLLLSILVIVLQNSSVEAQNVSILPGETTTIETAAVYNGDFGPSNTGGSGFSSNFNKGRGVLSIGAEIQSDGYASWDDVRIAFYYNGAWHNICQYNNKDNQSQCDYTGGPNSQYYTVPYIPIAGTCVYTAGNNYETYSGDASYTKVGKMGGGNSDRYQNICLKNNGSLSVYHGNYLAQSGVITDRVKDGDNNMWGIQTAAYTATGKIYPAFNDPNPSTKKTTGYDVNNYVQYGNLPGFTYDQYTTNIGVLIINIANLPPDMLEAPNFKVHVYALSNGNDHNRIYETTYNNQNFMLNGPGTLVASQDQCSGVNLSWSNSSNQTPDDGNVTIRNVIFRNGSYLATVAGSATTYSDLTAVQDVSYDYTVRHVAFSETGETYYRSPESAKATGSLKPRPDQPISPTASADDCTGKINLGWSFNGANPQYFKVESSSTSATGPWTIDTTTIAGAARNYTFKNATRGTTYYYRISAINSCAVQSPTYATCLGISPSDPAKATKVTATLNIVNESIDLTWNDNANNETKYQVVRTDDQGNTVLTDINANANSYSDNAAATCRLYSYKIRVFNSCVLSGTLSDSAATGTLPPPNLSNTFDAVTHKLICSKGYFNNRVELNWSNKNNNILSSIAIYRKVLGSTADSVQITTVSPGTGLYIDNTINAGVFYKYSIQGTVVCNGSTLTSNISEDIGFRSPTGIVNGQIEYTGGVAVKNVQITLQKTTGNNGFAAVFNGANQVTVKDAANLKPSASVSAEAWVNFSSLTGASDRVIAGKAGSYQLFYQGSTGKLIMRVISGGTNYDAPFTATPLIVAGAYNQICGVYDGSKVKLFINGAIKDSVTGPGSINVNTNPVIIGNGFAGDLKEIRIWNNKRLNSDVARDYQRVLNGDETGLSVLFHTDENAGTYLYDISEVGTTFNMNDGAFTTPTWSTTIPGTSQMGYIGYTDSTGNYTIAGVRYSANGENFKAVPAFGVHSFNPASQVMFIGDGAAVQNGINFTDQSAFRVQGDLKYDPSKFKNCTCPVPNAFISVDGNLLIVAGAPAKTDVNGHFDVHVPIGPHILTVSQTGHSYSAGSFPPTGTWNFQDSLSGLHLLDTTSVKVIGRVVGGTREAKKAMILGKSVNNIGKAEIIFHTQSNCYSDTIITNDASGDYVAYLPPMSYTIDNLKIVKNPASLSWNEFQNNPLLNVTSIPPVQMIYDSVFNYVGNKKVFARLDSGTYQKILSWDHREAPAVWVTDLRARAFAKYGGDSTFTYVSPAGVKTIYPINDSTFGYPVFTQSTDYGVKMGAIEQYTNLDHTLTPGKLDVVPVATGVFTINNALSTASAPVTLSQDSSSSGYISPRKDTAFVNYSFTGGIPNIAFNPATDNFLQQFSIDFTSGPNIVHWLPRAGATPFKGIMLGGQSSDGQGFVSTGPSVVEMVLRDPPGSNSFASFMKGTSVTSTYSWSNEGDIDVDMNKTIDLGTKFSLGIGMQTTTDISNEIALNAHVSTKISGQGQTSQTITTTETWSTDGTSAHVGAMSDIYVGRAMNLNFGVSENISILPSAAIVGKTGIDASEQGTVSGTGFTVIRRKSLAVLPQGYATSFMYTQDYIVNTLIPNLSTLRNQLFVNQPLKYKLVFSNVNDPKYGTNNDDPVWTGIGSGVSSANPFTTVPSDTTGNSYTYHGGNLPTIVKVKSTTGTIVTDTIPASLGDSVRWYNQQIRLWKQAVINNEKDKYMAYHDGTNLIQNYSISEGVTYTNTVETDNDTTTSNTFELGISAAASLKIGANIGGSGLEADQGITLGYVKDHGSSNDASSQRSFTYTLQDTGPGDYFSTDVRKGYQGWGPIFNITGGQTRCPYEAADTSIYFTDPGTGKNVKFGVSTLQTEKVHVKVDGNDFFSQKDNIPSDGQAVYDLEIQNLTESVPALNVSYAITVPAEKNPFGAGLTIDGFNPTSQLYPVGGGSSIHKQLVLKRGATQFNYDSIAVVAYSACGDGNVTDTIWISAHFLPACTDVALSAPLNQWVANNSFHDTLNTVVSGYDINYTGLKEITFEYKPSSQATWVPLYTWYKDSTGANAIPTSQAVITYPWVLTQLQDDHYDIRSTSTCKLKVGALTQIVSNQSPVISGVVDRINPAPFGTPSPGTGILNPGDDISIQFNKPLDGGALSDYNFDIRGVLNGAAIQHSTSLSFDGSTSYAEVPSGANLNKRDFSMEFWAMRTIGGQMAVISQSPDASNGLFFGFNVSNQLALRFGTAEIAGDKALAPVDGQWHHYAVTYRDTTQNVSLYGDFYGSGTTPLNSNTTMTAYYTGAGKLFFGKDAASSSLFFNGNLQDIRIWNNTLQASDISSRMNTVLSVNTGNLLYDWRMDEAAGTFANDAIRSLNASLVNTTWQITPNGFACAFDGSTGYVQLNTSKVGITPEMDFTLEFWFKSNQAGVATLWSNGKGDGLIGDSIYSWNIQKDASGFIHVLHDKIDFVATSSNYFDNTWHHFALVMQRASTLSAYIDGNPQNSMTSAGFKQMGGVHMYIGARGYQPGAPVTLTHDNYFSGSMDEVRLWNTARLIKQITRDKQNRLLGDEAGLVMYLPFESYKSVLGVPSMTASIMDFSTDSLVLTNTAGATTTAQTPALKLPRPIQAVSFTYSLNTDKIIMTSKMSPAEIENVTLDVTVQKVHDLDGNAQQSPKTWIAYINQNQVKWQTGGITLSKLLNAPLTFTATLVNSGGALKAYTIGNMPPWLTVDAPTGNIAPNSSLTVTFTIEPEVNIGNYTEDVTLTTDFNYAEKFTLDLKVYAQPPSWSVNSANYQYSEGVVGQIRIDGIVSSNPDDKLAAFAGGVCRGVTNLQYLAQYDKYYAVMDIYSNANTGDTITFKIWNAAEGKIHAQVTPSILLFSADSIRGTYVNPQMFDASDMLMRVLPLNTGWNWISVNVLCPDSTNLGRFLGTLHPHTGDELKGQSSFANYTTQNGWAGSLANSNAGVKIQPSYRIHVSQTDTLVFSGKQIDPTTVPITLTPGWNWTGFVSLRNLTVKEALASLNPSAGDIIKGQTSFALYDSNLGWAGSLVYLQPNQGYMIRSAAGGTFTFPITGINGKAQTHPAVTPQTTWTVQSGNYTNNMNVVAKLNCGGGTNNSLTLGAFVNGVCRGVVPVSTTTGSEGLFYLTVFSDNTTEQMSLKLMDESTGTAYDLDNSITFQVNGLQGNLQNPVPLSLHNLADQSTVCKSSATAVIAAAAGNATTLQAEPVPFSDQFSLNLNIAYGGPVNIKITSVTGQLIFQRIFQTTSGMNTMAFSAEQMNMPAGLYIVEMTSSQEKLVTRLIKK